MSHTISNSGDSVTVLAVDEYEATRSSRTVEHAIIDSSEPALTLRPAGPRRGTLRAVVESSAEGVRLLGVVAAAEVLEYACTDLPILDMSFVLEPGSEASMARKNGLMWVVSIPYLEVSS